MEQLWSRVGIHGLLPGLAPAEVRQIVTSSLGRTNEAAMVEIQRTTQGSARRLTKFTPQLKRLKELNQGISAERLVAAAAGQIIA